MHLIEEIYDGNLLRTVQSVVKMLNGMYVFAVTDGDEVVVARDPAGIKPIYYVEKEGRVYFCSEKKGLYDTEGKIRSIPPGKIMRVNKDGLSIHQGVIIERPQIDITDFDEAVTLYIDERTVEAVLSEIIETIELNGLLQVEVAVPMYLAAKAASEGGIKVMFNGQGADELFAGYYWWYKNVVKEDGFLKLHDKLWEDIDLAYDDTLEREDKVTMANSVELRVPYLDRNVVQSAMRISPRLKIRDGDDSTRKWVHRGVAAMLGVPQYTAYREKDMAQSGSGCAWSGKKGCRGIL